jgi:hypothetical protein
MASELPDIPHDMQRLYRRFERWRSADTGRLPIPERLWTAAAELARDTAPTKSHDVRNYSLQDTPRSSTRARRPKFFAMSGCSKTVVGLCSNRVKSSTHPRIIEFVTC